MDYRELLSEELKDPDFKKAWDELELEYMISSMIIKLRSEAKLSQSELAVKIGTTQSVVARMESGKILPKLDSLSKIAKACGKKIEITAR